MGPIAGTIAGIGILLICVIVLRSRISPLAISQLPLDSPCSKLLFKSNTLAPANRFESGPRKIASTATLSSCDERRSKQDRHHQKGEARRRPLPQHTIDPLNRPAKGLARAASGGCSFVVRSRIT
jgi:hypothetical protein